MIPGPLSLESTARPAAGSVMARITVEDCLEVVDNRFELVMMAAKRARQLANGVEAQIDNAENDDKPTVLALREIAARRIDRSEEHTSELQSLMRISYALFC